MTTGDDRNRISILYLGDEIREPMAIAIMSGLLYSILLTPGYVQVPYALLFRVEAHA